jgi:hypothetical protein
MIACHPVVPKEGRVALTLRLVGGLSTQEIARAFLLPCAEQKPHRVLGVFLSIQESPLGVEFHTLASFSNLEGICGKSPRSHCTVFEETHHRP